MDEFQALWEGARALSDLTRLRILRLTAERPLSVSELQHLLSASQSSVSQHLAKLRTVGLLSSERRGKEVFYSACLDGIARFDRAFSGLFSRPLPGIAEMRREWTRWQALDGEKPNAYPAGALTVVTGGAVTGDAKEKPASGSENAPVRGKDHFPKGKNQVRVLFVCTANAACSQMAEGWARALGRGSLVPASAGLEPAGVHPLAVAVMRELGIDITGQTSDPVDPALLREVDLIVTLCGDAAERCPVTPPNVRRLHWPLEDPAKPTGSGEEVLRKFRQVRDEIRRRAPVPCPLRCLPA